jgi:microcystin-dependent protein
VSWRDTPLHDKAFSASDQVHSQWETADIKWSASTATSKTGWLLCNGQEVSQTQYKRLYDDLGATFNTGGETAGCFRVPNIAGKTIVGLDSTDTDWDTLGETRGDKNLAAHAHVQSYYWTGSTASLAQQYSAGVGWGAMNGSSADQTASLQTTADAGTGTAGNIQPSIVLRPWIKT